MARESSRSEKENAAAAPRFLLGKNLIFIGMPLAAAVLAVLVMMK